jgi:Cu(I)/Ag(I) efflux system periplasmic protein CusF
MKVVSLAAVAFTWALALPALAQSAAIHNHGTPTAKAATSEMYDGQVRRVNKETHRVTLAHGPLTGFDMPAMTMAFPVKDPALLTSLREGDKVRFALEKFGENLVVTRIEPVK